MLSIRTMLAATALFAFAACAPAPEPEPAPPPLPQTETPSEPAGAIGGMCGGMTGQTCTDEAAYCEYAPEASCGAADMTGTCQIKPEICTAEYKPVCGCDGETYGNACNAAMEGVSIVHEGACEGDEGTTARP